MKIVYLKYSIRLFRWDGGGIGEHKLQNVEIELEEGSANNKPQHKLGFSRSSQGNRIITARIFHITLCTHFYIEQY